jgi:hypothetical protein
MSTKQDDIEAAMGALYGALLIAFREAKENGLRWYACEDIAEVANAEVFLDVGLEAKAKTIPF